MRRALLILALSLPAPAGAIELNAHAEALALVWAPVDFERVRGGELMFDISVFGVGLGLGGIYEELPDGDGALALDIMFQIRPGAWLGFIHNRFVFPHLEGGGTIGGDFGDSAGFRDTGWLGAGLDVRLMPGTRFLLATAYYRWMADRGPRDPAHMLGLGLGFRFNDAPDD